MILGLGSVVLIGLSVALRTDVTLVERDLYANMADAEAETRRAINELRNEVRRAALGGHEPVKAVASATPRPPRELPAYEEQQQDDRRPRPVAQGSADPYSRAREEREPTSGYVAETTAVPRQRWEDDYPVSGYENEGRDRRSNRHGSGQAVEAWRAEAEPTTPSRGTSRRARGVENGWSDEVYNSGSQPRASRGNDADSGAQPRASRTNGSDPAGGRGRHYREPDELDGVIPSRHYREDDDSGEIPSRHTTGSTRRREYASGESRSRGDSRSGGSYMDTYYGDSRR